MAWRSGGTTNDEMVNNLKRFGVIHSQAIEEGFRAVDRKYFVPRNRREIAHTDQPLKEGNIHISAPHIYGSVAEALELQPNSATSFLNIGAGTGYLSCIVAEILGPTSVNFGIELHADVLEHSLQSIQEWKAARASLRRTPMLEIVHGNGLHIDKTIGESRTGVDRIYIGAAVEKCHLSQFASLLKTGGILVGPVEDELVKVIRIGVSESDGTTGPPLSSSRRGLALSGDFSVQIISGVRFAPLLQQPVIRTVLPSRVWNPELHAYYPKSFRRACKQLLLCSNSSPNQPPPPVMNTGKNVAALLPRALWMEILSYTRSDWFEEPHSSDTFLRQRLHEAQVAAQRDREARIEAETRLQLVERERDIYRLLALRWQRRLQAAASERNGQATGTAAGDDDSIPDLDDVAAAAVFAADEPLLVRLGGGLGAVIRRFQEGSDDDEDDDDEDVAETEANRNLGQADMDEDSDVSVGEESMQDSSDVVAGEPMALSASFASSDLAVRSQARTVSISSEDL